MRSDPATHRELDSRAVDGLHVRLMWRADDGHLVVAVTDTRTHEAFSIEVRDGARALDVFHHPYAYATHSRVPAEGAGPHDRVNAQVPA